MPSNIIIRKQSFRVRTNSETTAVQVRQYINDELQFDILKVYEDVLGAFFGNIKETIYIDKLVLDLGKCQPATIAEVLPELLRQAMIKQLKRHDGKIIIGDEMDHPQNRSESRQPDTSIVAVLLYFFEHGILPWWHKQKGSIRLLVADLEKGEIESLLLRLIQSPKGILSIAQRMRQRFLAQLPQALYTRYIEMLTALQSDVQARTGLEALMSDEVKAYLIKWIDTTEIVYQRLLIGFLLEEIPVADRQSMQRFVSILEKQKKKDVEQKNEQRIPVVLKKIMDGLRKKEKKNVEEHDGMVEDTTTIEKKPEKQDLKKQPELPEDCIYINNGGLAILHPFLQPLFTALGLLDSDNQFIDEVARHKACVALYYLQSGEDAYAEEEMAFNKILCGMPVEDVLPAELNLTEADKKECNELLDAVIDYWDALKGASAGALQETFIRRSARLSFKNDHWLLQVERNATDILTDRLPWGIGIIKLPWLSHLIHTEW